MSQSTRRRKQSGFSLIAAIFLLVVLAGAGAFMMRMTGVQQATVTLGLQGARAYQAARSALEWAMFRVYSDQDCFAPGTELNFTADGLNGFRARLDCGFDEVDEAGHDPNPYRVYRLTATAEYGNYGQPDYIARRLQLTFAPPPLPPNP